MYANEALFISYASHYSRASGGPLKAEDSRFRGNDTILSYVSNKPIKMQAQIPWLLTQWAWATSRQADFRARSGPVGVCLARALLQALWLACQGIRISPARKNIILHVPYSQGLSVEWNIRKKRAIQKALMSSAAPTSTTCPIQVLPIRAPWQGRSYRIKIQPL